MSNILEFIAWLDDRKVLDAINALMTVALVLFAGVQLWRTEIERRERVRAAVGGFWIEYFRLWRVSKSWTDLDLTSLAYVDLFDPEEILPPEWGAILPLLGSLGPLPARLGGLAYAFAADAAAQARKVVYFARVQRELAASSKGTEFDQKQHDVVYRRLEEAIKSARDKANEAASLMEDALAAAPPWATRTKVDPQLLRSGPGKALAEKIDLRRAAFPLWRRTLGRFFPSLLLKVPDRV